MSQYKIVIDSCGELPEDLKADGHFCTVPLLLDVDGYQITDDETFNQRDFLQRVKACIHSPKSSCPSPERLTTTCFMILLPIVKITGLPCR